LAFLNSNKESNKSPADVSVFPEIQYQLAMKTKGSMGL